MLDNIAPGAKIQVKIVKRPTSAAAQKTLVRVLSKDADAQRENDRQRKIRQTHINPTRRGGRIWYDRVVKQHAVTAEAGESGTLVATLDVLRDLASVRRFIEVSPA